MTITPETINALQSYDEFVSVGQELTSAELDIAFMLGLLGVKAIKRYGEGTIAELAANIGISKSNLYSKVALVNFYGEDSLSVMQSFENLRLGHFRTAHSILKNHPNAYTLAENELFHASKNTLSVSDFQSYLLEKYKERPRYSVFQFSDSNEAIRAIHLLRAKSTAIEVTIKVVQQDQNEALEPLLDVGF